MSETPKTLTNPRDNLTTTPSFEFKPTTQGNKNTITPNINWNNKAEVEQYHAYVCASTGSDDIKAASYIFNNLTNVLIAGHSNPDEAATIITGSLHTLYSLKPQDAIEGMAIARLIALHNQSMDSLKQATNAKYIPQVDSCTNQAVKLMRVCNETMDALNRYRRKGEQKVTVQYVNIGNGGQAVVSGEFNQGGGEKKMKGVPHANQ